MKAVMNVCTDEVEEKSPNKVLEIILDRECDSLTESIQRLKHEIQLNGRVESPTKPSLNHDDDEKFYQVLPTTAQP